MAKLQATVNRQKRELAKAKKRKKLSELVDEDGKTCFNF